MIPHGIDPRPYERRAEVRAAVRRDLGCPEDAVLVLFAGRLDEAKGPMDLYQSFRLAAADTIDMRLLIAGEGPLFGELQASIANEHLGDRVRLLGHRSDLPSLYQAADIFVLPSRREAFGIVLLEAMAASVAVIASRTGGIVDVVEDSRTGRLVPPKDTQALAQAMLALARDRSRREELGRAGRDVVLQGFSLARMARETERVYREAWEAGAS
jgi:glycosyltransferase involved in cell wall biosynthesis